MAYITEIESGGFFACVRVQEGSFKGCPGSDNTDSGNVREHKGPFIERQPQQVPQSVNEFGEQCGTTRIKWFLKQHSL